MAFAVNPIVVAVAKPVNKLIPALLAAPAQLRLVVSIRAINAPTKAFLVAALPVAVTVKKPVPNTPTARFAGHEAAQTTAPLF